MEQSQNKKQMALGFAILIAIFAGLYWLITSLWSWFSALNSDLAVGMLTASSTIIVATVTLVLGRYLERVKEAESHLRSQKIEMYDEFLKQLFSLFHQEGEAESEDLVSFLQEWQRKLVVWGGPNVLKTFIKWKEYMSYKEPDAQTVFLMDEFFRAMRKDIGLSNKNLDKGFFSHLILRHASLFLAEAKENPKVTLSEVAAREKELGL
ncbi:hypothetical protein [Chromohalobacter israelensis]|uniref:hypothetical protein n=1 Tax=Chromohalobacter israelensis TaxID=141390 RepID=UPI00265BE706|nr:hypothetical protein [Chromohalobacter salexigens]MDO0946111.1 hypothetical protein [Chromohalobacter salexigens]